MHLINNLKLKPRRAFWHFSIQLLLIYQKNKKNKKNKKTEVEDERSENQLFYEEW